MVPAVRMAHSVELPLLAFGTYQIGAIVLNAGMMLQAAAMVLLDAEGWIGPCTF